MVEQYKWSFAGLVVAVPSVRYTVHGQDEAITSGYLIRQQWITIGLYKVCRRGMNDIGALSVPGIVGGLIR